LLALLLSALVRLALATIMPGVKFLPLTWVILFVAGAILLGLASSFASVEPGLRSLERRYEPITH